MSSQAPLPLSPDHRLAGPAHPRCPAPLCAHPLWPYGPALLRGRVHGAATCPDPAGPPQPPHCPPTGRLPRLRLCVRAILGALRTSPGVPVPCLPRPLGPHSPTGCQLRVLPWRCRPCLAFTSPWDSRRWPWGCCQGLDSLGGACPSPQPPPCVSQLDLRQEGGTVRSGLLCFLILDLLYGLLNIQNCVPEVFWFGEWGGGLGSLGAGAVAPTGPRPPLRPSEAGLPTEARLLSSTLL